MLPEERAREKIDRQLKKAGWDIVSREEYIPHSASAVKEAFKYIAAFSLKPITKQREKSAKSPYVTAEQE